MSRDVKQGMGGENKQILDLKVNMSKMAAHE